MSTPNDLELYKLKKPIRHLESAQDDGTSMITITIPPGTQITKTTKMLTDKYGAASNIKSSKNRHSVQTAIRSAQAKFKLVNKLMGKRRKLVRPLNRPRLSRLVCLDVKITFS